MGVAEDLSSLRDEALDSVASANDLTALEAVRVAFLGKRGSLTSVLRGLGALAPQDRPVIGQLANQIREELEKAIATRRDELASQALAARLQAEYSRHHTARSKTFTRQAASHTSDRGRDHLGVRRAWLLCRRRSRSRAPSTTTSLLSIIPRNIRRGPLQTRSTCVTCLRKPPTCRVSATCSSGLTRRPFKSVSWSVRRRPSTCSCLARSTGAMWPIQAICLASHR